LPKHNSTGLKIEDPAHCGEVLDQALAAPGPVLVEAVVDPFTPPLPAKITLEQASHFAQSLARGEPNRAQIAWTVIADRVRELI
jgi:pyruvate dehydrogenase (quinone)/pyruvate oxidase